MLRRTLALAFALMLVEARSAGAQQADDTRSAGVSPAPISEAFLPEGQSTLSVIAAGGHLSAPDNRPDRDVWMFGAGGVYTYGLTDRWFLTGSLMVAMGFSGDTRVTIAGLNAGGGLRLLGDATDWYGLSVVGSVVGVSSILPGSGGVNEVSVTGSGFAASLQGELFPIRWVSLVPYVTVNHLALVTVEFDNVEVARAEPNVTWSVAGLDIWFYPNPEYRRSHIGLSALANLGQSSNALIFSLGYSFSFGAPEESTETKPTP